MLFLFDWWDVPLGCIGLLLCGVSLLGGCICMVRCFVLLSEVVVCFVCLLFGGMPCSAVMFCSCGLLFVVCCCKLSLAVLLFGCMFVLCWL